jgi:hypothetical protein
MNKRCGNCKHTDNDLGIVSLQCDLVTPHESLNRGKVRSYEQCMFKLSRWEVIENAKEKTRRYIDIRSVRDDKRTRKMVDKGRI